jgi:hypothetical protein
VWKPYVCILETIAGNTLLADNLLEPKLGFHHCVSDTATINKVWASSGPVFSLRGGRLQYVQINLTDLQVQRINAIKAYVQDQHHRKLEVGQIYLSEDVGNATLSIYNTEDNKFIGYFHKDMFEDWITLNRENILNDLLEY